MWMIVMSAVIAGVILLDQISKLLIVANLYEGQVTLIPGVLRFTYVENTGMAFGLLSDHRWVFLALSAVGILLIGFYLFRYAKTTLCRLSLALIVGGGIGNMIDRIARGYVVDFIDFCAFPNVWYWVFNIADAAVTVGGVIFAVGLIFEIVEEYRNAPANRKKSEPTTDSAGAPTAPVSGGEPTGGTSVLPGDISGETPTAGASGTGETETEAPEAKASAAETSETKAPGKGEGA